jgi:hypothetical protein
VSLLTHDFPTADQAGSFAHDPALRAGMERAGEALLGELDRRVRLTFDVSQPAATALAVIDGAGAPLTPSQVSERLLVPPRP